MGKIAYHSNTGTTSVPMKRPDDLREGVYNALTLIKDGIDDTAKAFSETAAKVHEKRGITGAVGGVLRQVPSSIIKPVIVATAATHNVLEGVKSQVAPEIKK